MFTIEMEDDETLITMLGNGDHIEDVSISLGDEYVFIRQWNDDIDSLDEVIMTSEMYYSLMQAWSLPEGSYTLERTKL